MTEIEINLILERVASDDDAPEEMKAIARKPYYSWLNVGQKLGAEDFEAEWDNAQSGKYSSKKQMSDAAHQRINDRVDRMRSAGVDDHAIEQFQYAYGLAGSNKVETLSMPPAATLIARTS